MSVEFPEEQQQFHIILVRLFRLLELHCRSDGEYKATCSVLINLRKVDAQVTEYYVIRKGHYNVVDLYETNSDAWYWYTYGVNFRQVPFFLATREG